MLGRACAGSDGAGRPLDCGNAGTLVRLPRGSSPARPARRSSSTGDESLSRAPDGADRRAARPHGRAGRDDRRPPAADDRGRSAPRRSTTCFRSRARRSSRRCCSRGSTPTRADDGGRAGADPRPHRADARRGGRAASASARASVDRPAGGPARRWATSRCRATSPRRRRSSSRRRSCPGSELHIHGVNLNPRRTGLLEILERMGARITVYNRRADRRRAGRRPRGPLARARRDDASTAREVPLAIDELPLFALAAACARGESVVRGARGAPREGDGPDRGDGRRAARARRRARGRRDDGFTVTGVPARLRGGRVDEPRRPPARDARRGRGARVARGRADRGRGAVGVSFPGFFEMLDELRRAVGVVEDAGDRRLPSSAMIVAIDGPAGAGKSSVAQRARGAARLPLPRHGRDVPRAHLAGAARGRPARRRPGARGARRARIPSLRRRRPGRRSPARTSRRGSASRRSTRRCRSSPATRRCAR